MNKPGRLERVLQLSPWANVN